MVAEVDDSCELRVVHASHVEQGVTAGVARQHSPVQPHVTAIVNTISAQRTVVLLIVRIEI